MKHYSANEMNLRGWESSELTQQNILFVHEFHGNTAFCLLQDTTVLDMNMEILISIKIEQLPIQLRGAMKVDEIGKLASIRVIK